MVFFLSPEGMVLNSFEIQFPIYFMKTSMRNLKTGNYYYTFLIQNKTHIVNSTVRPTITSSLIDMAFFFVQLMLFKLKLLTLAISKKNWLCQKPFLFFVQCDSLLFLFAVQFTPSSIALSFFHFSIWSCIWWHFLLTLKSNFKCVLKNV